MFKRSLWSAVAVVAALSLFASDLWAHGGQFRGPGGKVPPGMREPSDPTPPAPPPQSGPPTTPPPTTGPVTPGPKMPGAGPDTPPPSTGPTMPNKGPARKSATQGFEAWPFWWENNKERYLNLKSALYSRNSSDSSIFHVGGRGDSGKSDSMHDIQAKVEKDIIPALVWTMKPENFAHQDIESAAYIALAKMATEWKHVEAIMKGMDPAFDRQHVTVESAALALGMLRRTDEERRFSAAEYDKVREFLFKAVRNDDLHTRARSFAAFALGMLGDQPTGSKAYLDNMGTSTQEAAAELAGAQATTAALFELLKGDYANDGIQIAIFMAIGMQDPTSLVESQRATLRECAQKGRLFKQDVKALIQSYAVLQLGRIGNKDDIGILQRVLINGDDANVQRSAAIGLGTLASLISSQERAEIAKMLLGAIKKKKIKEPSSLNFTYISLAYLVNEDVKAGKTDVIENTNVREFLVEESENGRAIQRPFAALSLGLIGREIGVEADIDAYGKFHKTALDALRAGVISKKIDKLGRGAFALSLGLIRDRQSIKTLVDLVSDNKEDTTLRGYAAVGIGLTGEAPNSAKVAVRSALKERRSKEMRIQCATALGIMQDGEALPLLIEELKKAKSQSVKGQVVLAMAQIGTEDAVDPLVSLLRNESRREKDLTRALACAGLGVIGDLELIPSLSRISANINYRASSPDVDEVLSII